MSRWLTTAEFAGLAAIDGRRARKALLRAFQLSKPWRGSILAVRLSPAGGGPRGLGYEVLADTLPADLQERLKASPHVAPDGGEGASAETTRRAEIVGPIIARKRGTRERRAAFHAAITAHQLTETTLRRWVRDTERDGIAGLRRKPRSDKGEKRCLISQRWFDQASKQLDRAALEKIDTALSLDVRSQWRESPKRTLFTAGHKLRQLTVAAGYMPTGKEPRRMFDVPRGYLVAHRIDPRKARTFLDAKRRQDLEPAMRRKLGDRPLAVVDIDAMHFDHIVSRADGSPAYPKAIVFADRATHQVFVVPFLLGPREGIRQEHVAVAIIQFIEANGVPETFYIDNGGEFRAVDDLNDILQLVAQVRSIGGRPPVVRAQPYGARAKIVENLIGVLQRVWLSGVPGHVGNNRINRVTQQVGKPTLPFPGTFQDFARMVALRVAEMNACPMGGKLKGRSPDEVMQAHIDNGFERHGVDRASLMLAFSTRETRQVRPYGIEVGGEWWTCKELQRRSGETIGILKARFKSWRWPAVPLYDLSDHRTIIGYATRNDEVDGMDPANARESGNRKKLYRQPGRELLKSAAPYDPIADTQAVAPLLPPPPVAPIAGTIVPNEPAPEIVKNITEPPAARAARERAEAEQRQIANNERIARGLARLQGSK
jgi:hypothetical protein